MPLQEPSISFESAQKKVTEDPAFQAYKKEYPTAYLVNAFLTKSGDQFSNWQFGYYVKEHEKIAMFEVTEANILAHPPDDIYKEPGKTVMRLLFPDVTVPLSQALASVNDAMRARYVGELANKEIILLQALPEWGTIWNITVLSTSFHVINFKIDAKSGKLVHEQRESLTTLPKKDEQEADETR
jgi:hypothetical protein